jgi:hypothetical protein
MTANQTCPATPIPTGRAAAGRFAKGNPGGPGNPFYRRQAEFRRACLELFTPEDVMSLLRVMLALGRNGDVAAAKVFLEYVIGKPHQAPDPDREDLHEAQLQAEARRLAEDTERLDNGTPADPANNTEPHLVPALPIEPAVTEVTGDNGVTEAEAAGPARAPRSREALRLLMAGLRAAVANGVNGMAGEKYQGLADRLTGVNGGRTVPTADIGQESTVPTEDNGGSTGQQTWPGGSTEPNGACAAHSG